MTKGTETAFVIAFVCGACGGARECDHPPDFCGGCRARFDKRPLAVLRSKTVVQGTTVRNELHLELIGAWSEADTDAAIRALGAERVRPEQVKRRRLVNAREMES